METKPCGMDDTARRVYEDIAYGSESSQKFDMYVPTGRSKKSYGLVVYIHGGGFTGGDKRDDAEILRGFAARGFVAADVNYTLHTASSPESSVYSMSCEIKSSIPAICDKAMELGFPLEAWPFGGGSAGGCLALLYAYRDSGRRPRCRSDSCLRPWAGKPRPGGLDRTRHEFRRSGGFRLAHVRAANQRRKVRQ